MTLDARGRLALMLGAAGLLAGGGFVYRARHLQQVMETEGVPATKDWAIALGAARRPDDLQAAAACFAIAGLALIAWALVRAARAARASRS